MKWTCLKDNPKLKEKISKMAARLDSVAKKDEDRHLADVGLLLNIISGDLKELSEDAFNLHEEQATT